MSIVIVLVKYVIEAILVHWMSLSFIPMDVLEQIRRLSFKLLWVGDMEKKGVKE
jgi:hypothetical protein